MPLKESQEREVKHRLTALFMDTVETFELLALNADLYFGKNSGEIKVAIEEYLEDFIKSPDGKERKHPEQAIFEAARTTLQNAGFYGAQLDLKERHVREANTSLREAISTRTRAVFRSPFKRWVNRINNFLGSLSFTGVGEALRELKDCLRDELPDD